MGDLDEAKPQSYSFRLDKSPVILKLVGLDRHGLEQKIKMPDS